MALDLSFSDDYWGDLEKVIDRVETLDKIIIKKGYDFMSKAHKAQLRYSGALYESHPAWIAKVVAQLNIGQEAVLAALLHDCIEDTSITINEISKEFGDEVALLVTGLTEIKTRADGIIINQTNIDVFRKFFFSSIDDVRVLIIRIVDKLHNCSTIEYLPKEKQIVYAQDIMKIYGPLAEYVGLHYFKKKIEDISFQILYPSEANKIQKIFEEEERNELKALNLVREELGKMLKINNINNAIIEGRMKSLYSTYLKMKRKGNDYKIRDRIAIRVLTDNLVDCYTVLGLIHARYQYSAEDFKDYIATPKVNGYRSIQTTIFWKNKTMVEIQIKTKEMHEFNEFGPASHIAYKTGKGKNGMGMEWVKDLYKWQINDNNIKNYRIKVLTNFVYVFTPKGDTIQLPNRSTALDFAFRIHTRIGERCKGVKINNKIAKIDTQLKTGDLVEILVGKKINVNKNWLEMVTTQAAKEYIRKALKFEY